MRKPLFLSPTSVALFKQSPEDYYKQYLCASRIPRAPQTQPMSVGSAFDAQVKAALHKNLFGQNHPDSAKFELRTLFEAQVEPHNRDWAWEAGDYVFKWYNECGALADLMIELNKAVTEPRFEMAIQGVIDGYREGRSTRRLGVPILGKPDLYFINGEGAHVIHDWKVNGYCSKSAVSPKPGYYKIRDAYSYADCAMSRGGDMHKDCSPVEYKGIWINGGATLDFYEESWAAQLAAYSWVLGEPVGAETLGSIDQIVAKPGNPKPYLRVASHRAKIGADFQYGIFENYVNLWGILNDEPFYFFRHLSFEDSKARCEQLDSQAITLYGPEANLTDEEAWMLEASRS